MQQQIGDVVLLLVVVVWLMCVGLLHTGTR
jgi:hypothetical protein